MKKQLSSLIVVIVIGLIAIIILSSRIFHTLQPGENAVIFRKFSTGLDKDHIFHPGFYVIAPWNELYIYDVREQIESEDMDVLDKNGLSIHAEVSVRYFPAPEKIGYLHEKFGVKYREILIAPEVRSVVRQVMGRYEAIEIFSTKRDQVEKEIVSETGKILHDNNVEMKTLLIRSIRLPEQIKKAIEEKLKKEQEAVAMKYELDKAIKQAQKDSITAYGKAVANRIVNSSLTENLLRMRGIEATKDLASSPNTKVVIVGGGKDGLPLILGGDK